jgi:hypothetical protein
MQVDGTKGTAIVGLRDCLVQHASATPRSTWNPDIDSPIKHMESRCRVPDWRPSDNALKWQWELFLLHVVKGGSFPWDLREGAKRVQLAELALRSCVERRTLEVPTPAG